MTPFDVVKTRLQSGFIVNSNETTLVLYNLTDGPFSHSNRKSITHYLASNDQNFWKRRIPISLARVNSNTCTHSSSDCCLFCRVWEIEGWNYYRVIHWLLCACYIWHTGKEYDYLCLYVFMPSFFASIIVGFAVTLTNPIELVRTRVQAGNESLGSVLTTFSKMIKVNSCLFKVE